MALDWGGSGDRGSAAVAGQGFQAADALAHGQVGAEEAGEALWAERAGDHQVADGDTPPVGRERQFRRPGVDLAQGPGQDSSISACSSAPSPGPEPADPGRARRARPAGNVITVARPADSDEPSTSWPDTCASSCPSTPRSSASSSTLSRPSVQQIAAERGPRPTAKEFGCSAGDRYSRGTGSRPSLLSSRTSRYSSGCSTSLTGRASMADRT